MQRTGKPVEVILSHTWIFYIVHHDVKSWLRPFGRKDIWFYGNLLVSNLTDNDVVFGLKGWDAYDVTNDNGAVKEHSVIYIHVNQKCKCIKHKFNKIINDKTKSLKI